MLKLEDFRITKENICQPEKIVNLCKKYNVEFVNYEKLRSGKLNRNTKNICFMLGDMPFTNEIFKQLSHNIIVASNNVVLDKRVISVPIFVTNTSWCKVIGNLDVIVEQFKKPKFYGEKGENLLYMNFNNSHGRNYCYFEERNNVYDLFNSKDWVTKGTFERNHDGHRRFVEQIYNHKFILCPWGNGVDTHRLWMSLYLGSIPVTKDHPTYQNYRHLPIIFINDWNEVTEEFLHKKYEEISNKTYDFSILNINYWDNLFSSLS